jgi:CheY-like chemotaxis protein
MTARILVCDDEPHITRAIALKLQRAGYEVLAATDGQAAWERAQEIRPQLLITDYQMPGWSGLDLVTRVREIPHLVDMPVILLTAKGFELEGERERMAALGVEHLVTKPFSPRDLAQLVSTLLATAAPAV